MSTYGVVGRHRSRFGSWARATWSAAIGIGLAWFTGAEDAKAQGQYFTLDRAILSGAPDDGFMVYRPKMSEETRFYGNGALGFTLNPLRKDAVTGDPDVRRNIEDLVHGQIPMYLSGGTQIAGRFGFNLHIPIIAGQITGDDPAGEGVGQGGINQAAAMGDVRLDARAVAWTSDNGRTAFGGTGAFTFATGTEGAFGGDRGPNALILAQIEHDFGDFFITGHIGPHFKPFGSIGGTNGDLRIGNELRWAVGLFLPLRDNRLRLGAELWGSTGIESVQGQNTFFSGRNTTLEWMAQGRLLLDESKRWFANAGAGTRLTGGYGSADFRLLASVGMYFTLTDLDPPAPPLKLKIVPRKEHYDEDADKDGYPDAIDACPGEAEDGKTPKASDGCPAPPDRDGDGIPDAKDRCPDEAEDFDGLADEDGCPEEDSDKDKVIDRDDACPEEPGPPNRQTDLNGCPTLTKLTEDGKIQILKSVEFDVGRATIRAVSFPILEEVVTLMAARTDIDVAVHGHTDNKGERDKNVKLSKDRASAVVKYLVEHGIAASRLSSDGFGPDKPIDTNNTDIGRAKNRRVEFIVKEKEAAADESWTE